MKFDPDAWQSRLLLSRRKKIIVNIARQQGKSTTAAAKALHRALFFPKSVILIVAPAVKQSSELRRKVEEFIVKLRDTGPELVDVKNKEEIEFSNGSRIIVLAADEDTVRSYTADMIIEDESATVPENVYQAMKAMLLVKDGQHILLGTPKGIRKHHFPDIWHDVDSTWERYQVTAWDNTRIPNNKAKLEEERAEQERLGRLWWFQQEFECSFVAAAQGLVYPYENSRNYTLAIPQNRNWQYVLGIDYGFNDSTAFVVLGWQPHDPVVYVVESFDKRGLLAGEAAELAFALTRKYAFARMVGDMGGFGKGYVEEARRRYHLPIEPAKKENKRGYIELMASDMRAKLLKVFPGNAALLDEWAKLPWDEEREMPMDGHKDHLSDACLYAWRACAHFLEEVRQQGPLKGTRAAYEKEAEDIFERRMREVAQSKEKSEWWDDGAQNPMESMTDTMGFLN